MRATKYVRAATVSDGSAELQIRWPKVPIVHSIGARIGVDAMADRDPVGEAVTEATPRCLLCSEGLDVSDRLAGRQRSCWSTAGRRAHRGSCWLGSEHLPCCEVVSPRSRAGHRAGALIPAQRRHDPPPRPAALLADRAKRASGPQTRDARRGRRAGIDDGIQIAARRWRPDVPRSAKALVGPSPTR